MTLSRNNFLYLALLAILAAGMLFSACSQQQQRRSKDQPEEKKQGGSPTPYKKPSSGFSDTLEIIGPAAVFFAADSIQLDKIKAVTGEMVHESNMHDCFFQMRNARLLIKKYWQQVKIIEPARIRFLLFVKKDKSSRLTDLDAMNDMCGLLLFNGSEEPRLADMTNVDTALSECFRE